jgi:hypothetical protein
VTCLTVEIEPRVSNNVHSLSKCGFGYETPKMWMSKKSIIAPCKGELPKNQPNIFQLGGLCPVCDKINCPNVGWIPKTAILSHQRMSSFLSISDSKHVAEWSSEGHSLHEWMPSDTPAGFLESMESAVRNSRCFILAFTMLYDSWRRQICGLVCFKRNWTQPSMILIITLCLYQKKHISGWW